MNRTIIAVDLAKDVFEVAVSRFPGRVQQHRRLTRTGMVKYFTSIDPARVVMEACSGAHYWGRRLREIGHEVVLLPPQYIRPYVRRNKTDRADAKGILEAYRNEEIQPVPIKSPVQQAMAALHRIRSTWVSARRARHNLVRATLRELGILIPLGSRHVAAEALLQLEDPESPIPQLLRPTLHSAVREIIDLNERIASVDRELIGLSVQIPAVELLLTIPGIGVITATALIAHTGDLTRFRSGRHFASYLGLTCRESSSGRIRRLGRISKQGNTYLRTLLVQCGCTLLMASKRKESTDPLRAWGEKIREKRGWNIAKVAIANKLARYAWAVAGRGEVYRPSTEEKKGEQ